MAAVLFLLPGGPGSRKCFRNDDGVGAFHLDGLGVFAPSVVELDLEERLLHHKRIMGGNSWAAEFHGEQSERRRTDSAVDQQRSENPSEQHVRFCYHQNQFAARWHVPFHLAGKDGQPRSLSLRVVRLSSGQDNTDAVNYWNE